MDALAERVLAAVAEQPADGPNEFLIDAGTLTDRQSLRLLRPLLAYFATRSAAETGTAINLYGGCFAFVRLAAGGPAWVHARFENRPGSVWVTLCRSDSPHADAEPQREAVTPGA